MPNTKNPFGDYAKEPQTVPEAETPAAKVDGRDVGEILEPERYGAAKPRRVVIRAKITNGGH